MLVCVIALLLILDTVSCTFWCCYLKLCQVDCDVIPIFFYVTYNAWYSKVHNIKLF
jgi:hypothetical protein